ncbi:MAG: hypothetical protein IJY01_00395 [Clostridia bacterium]|nr:hypothetical protein [Clostridia bacterium]
MTDKKRKLYYWIFKGAGILISCALPIWAICERFPLWTETSGAGVTIGAGLVLIAIVLLIVFRRTVFKFAKDKLNLKYAPPMTIWIIFLIISYSLIYITDAIQSLNTVFWMGLIGSAIGSLLTYIAEHKFTEVKADE